MSAASRAATALGLLAVVFWSTTVGVTRSTIEALGPTGAPAVLFTLATLLLAVRRTPLSDIPRRYLWLGGALFVGYELCFVLALGLARSRQETIEVSMVNYLWPSLTVLVSTLAARRRLNAMMLAGLTLATAGVVFASSPPEGLSASRFVENAASNPLSYGLAFVGAIVWALYSTCTRHMANGKSALWLFMGLSALAFWIAYGLQPPATPMTWNARVVVLVAFSCIAMTLAYAFWNTGVLRGNIQLLGLAANTTPLMSALFASVLLSAPLSRTFWTGAAAVVAGSILAGWGANRSGLGRPRQTRTNAPPARTSHNP